MFKNKLVNIMLIMLVALTLVGALSIVLVNNLQAEEDPSREPTIDEIVSQSFETEEITTNLQSNDFARAKFLIHVSSKGALQEIEKRDFQVNNIIIRTLAGKESEQLSGATGIEQLENQLMEEINSLMQGGSVIRVYTTEWVIQ